MSNSNPVSIAVFLVGLQPLSKAVGVSYQMIRKYERTGTSAERVLDLSRATGWRVTPHDLRVFNNILKIKALIRNRSSKSAKPQIHLSKEPRKPIREKRKRAG